MQTSTMMMIFFILLLIVSIWKIYAFLPNEQLLDDDTTKEAQNTLKELMIKVIKENSADIDSKKLFELMINDAEFDKERFWRFNQNKLNNLLSKYKQETKI
ncbi:MAG: hypothetical protein PHI38_05175 [Sulfurimonas sp.]|uniref:hypothetical protein n=1 Tax=Sulfurimonas sp. TaxID=2022749 RepID=UPI00261DF5E2|nr:hypothetical protein [Sulfurimonas sp.]MDD3476239.1 hypothetical protein [Sulfurimonas sp.]